jgi:hypothetical protein
MLADNLPLEKVLRKKVVHLLKANAVYYESKPPMGMGTSGLDITACIRGRFMGIEVKRSPKHEMTPRQAACAHAIQKSGGMFMLIRKDPDIARLEEIIECELRGSPEAKLAQRETLEAEFDAYVLDVFREYAHRMEQERIAEYMQRQQAAMQAQHLANPVTLGGTTTIATTPFPSRGLTFGPPPTGAGVASSWQQQQGLLSGYNGLTPLQVGTTSSGQTYRAVTGAVNTVPAGSTITLDASGAPVWAPPTKTD